MIFHNLILPLSIFREKVSESRTDSGKAQTYPHPTDAQPTYWAVVRRVVWISRQQILLRSALI